MKNRVRAIVIKDGLLLTIKRIKNNNTYWVFPGGGIDDGENHQQALIRECKEELGVDVFVGNFFLEHIFTQGEYGLQKEFFYECKIIGGAIGTGNGPEFNLDSNYEGTREIQWNKISDLNELDLRPVEIKNKLLENYKSDKMN